MKIEVSIKKYTFLILWKYYSIDRDEFYKNFVIAIFLFGFFSIRYEPAKTGYFRIICKDVRIK
jgi:hypothetical protein